ncbi:uncharacterized protein LOC118435715 [Folsomia candida]|uniref:Poly(A) RNA polymerase GLD2 n=1 Tax=Folsomia candida TaxID=158441 RepID=A0A226E7Y2_FOLCA|nr:uncharacterized protein LOC118435715 [Folsomia candida]OXA53715.1 Poly(A) RNA polymerase GLD2 [Folsomia candida]
MDHNLSLCNKQGEVKSTSSPVQPPIRYRRPHPRQPGRHHSTKIRDNSPPRNIHSNIHPSDLERLKTLPPSDLLSQLVSTNSITIQGRETHSIILAQLTNLLQRKFMKIKLNPISSVIGYDTSQVEILVENFSEKDHSKCEINSVASQVAQILRTSNLTQVRIDNVQLFRKEGFQSMRFVARTSTIGEADVFLSFVNVGQVQLSRLVTFYLKLHPVIEPVTKLVQLWADYHQFYEISRECLTWMVLMYAGYEEIIPSVARMQSFLKYPEDKVNGWDVTIPLQTDGVKILSEFPPSIPTNSSDDFAATVMELVKEFFHYYAKLDFEKDFVCTNTLQIVSKTALAAGSMPKPHEEEGILKYFKWFGNKPKNEKPLFDIPTSFCIQNPLCLNHNLARGVRKEIITHFQHVCSTTYKHMEANPPVISFFDTLFPIPSTFMARIRPKKYIPVEDLQNIVTLVYTSLKKSSPHETCASGWLGLRIKPPKNFVYQFAFSMNELNITQVLGSWLLFRKLEIFWGTMVDDFLQTFLQKSFNTVITQKEQNTVENLRSKQPRKSRKYVEILFAKTNPATLQCSPDKFRKVNISSKTSVVESLEKLIQPIVGFMTCTILKCTCSTPLVHLKFERDTNCGEILPPAKRMAIESPFDQMCESLHQTENTGDEPLHFEIFVKMESHLGYSLPIIEVVFRSVDDKEMKSIQVLAEAISQSFPKYAMDRLRSLLRCED